MAYVHIISNLTSSLPKRATAHERRKLRLATLARRHGIDPRRQPVVCSRNGVWISQKQWRRISAKRNDIVVFCIIPRSDGLRTAGLLVALVAAAVVAPYLLGAVGLVGAAGSGALFATGSLGAAALTAATTAGLVIGSNYLLNVLIPVKPAGNISPQSLAQDAVAGSLESPTYSNSISAQNSVARLGAAIPVLYGRVRFIPDLASAPWVEWSDQAQILRQVFVLTQGEMQIEKIELGLSDLSSFDDISYEVVEPGDPVTLFFPEVFTNNQVTNIVLTPPNDPSVVSDQGQFDVATTYALNDYVYVIAFGTRNYYRSLFNGNVGHTPPNATWWVFVGTSIAGVDGTTVYKGPFVASPPGRTCAQIGVDLSFPSGLYILDPVTGDPDPAGISWVFHCQEIDDAGNPIGPWEFLDFEDADSTGVPLSGEDFPQSHFISAGYQYASQRTSPITASWRIDLPRTGRFQIRAFRNSDKELSGTVGHDIAWVGLRGFLETTRAYGDCTMLALEIRNSASSSINDQSAHQVAVTGTRKLRTWTGTSWTAPFASRNIARAIADILTNPTYGGNLTDEQYDKQHLFGHLAGIWITRGDFFDYYAATTSSLWAMLGLALRAGRTVAYHQSGIVRFHRDEPQTIPTMLFSSENIVKGTFQMNFIMPSPEDETDSIEVDYFNEDTWLSTQITLPKPGVFDPVSPSVNSLDGVTQADQAQREGEYLLAADQYRRVLVSFDTELEGLIASRGDLILVHHDMPRWGQSTRVYNNNDPDPLLVTLWGRLDFGDFSGSWFAYFRDRAGRVSAPVSIVSHNDDDMTIVLGSAPLYPGGGAFDMTATRSEPLHMVVGKSTEVPREAIFLGAVPRNSNIVSVSAVLEDSRVHVN